MAETWKKLAFEDDVVTKALFDADTFLYATDDNTPVATSPANVLAALTGHAGAGFDFNSQVVTMEDLIIADAGSIGSASEVDAIKIAADGTLTMKTCVNAGEDVDKFLVWDASGNVDYRTGAEVLSDIGALASGVDTSGTPVANDFARFTDEDTIEGLSYAETMAALSGGAAAAFSFNNQQIQDALMHIVADDAAKTALTAAVGMFVWQTDDACVYICTEGE
jgi:hypothetical protein